jgi:hypothetical protein
MCEHKECEHSLGPGSHCDTCDRIAIDEARLQREMDALRAAVKACGRAHLRVRSDVPID